jgi:hypothetical protein
MMLCLALRSRPELVYERALRQFSVEEITEGFAATRGLAMPSQLRHMLREKGRDLHAEFLDLLPTRPAPISTQRFSLRRFGLALRSDPAHVYQRALGQFSVEEITEGFAAARGLALPSQLRHLLRAQGRNLHAEFVRLLPSPPRPIRVQRWSARRIGLWAAILGLLVLAALNPKIIFNNDVAVATPLGVKDVGCGDLEQLWLLAQSVPSASLIPCVQLVPVDWKVAEVAVNNGRSVITLDHDRGGRAAMVVRLTASCDLAGATEVTSEQRGARRYLRVDPATRIYDFSGGCVTQRFRAAGPSALRLSDTASSEFGFISREELRRALSQRSHGRLELDP